MMEASPAFLRFISNQQQCCEPLTMSSRNNAYLHTICKSEILEKDEHDGDYCQRGIRQVKLILRRKKHEEMFRNDGKKCHPFATKTNKKNF